jgi:hypothetical protein
MTRDAQWTKKSGEILGKLEQSANARRDAKEALDREINRIEELLREGDAHGVPVDRMAKAVGLQRSRVYRMLGGGKGKWSREARMLEKGGE